MSDVAPLGTDDIDIPRERATTGGATESTEPSGSSDAGIKQTCSDNHHCERQPSHHNIEEPPGSGSQLADETPGVIPVPAIEESDSEDEGEHGDMIQNGFVPSDMNGESDAEEPSDETASSAVQESTAGESEEMSATKEIGASGDQTTVPALQQDKEPAEKQTDESAALTEKTAVQSEGESQSSASVATVTEQAGKPHSADMLKNQGDDVHTVMDDSSSKEAELVTEDTSKSERQHSRSDETHSSTMAQSDSNLGDKLSEDFSGQSEKSVETAVTQDDCNKNNESSELMEVDKSNENIENVDNDEPIEVDQSVKGSERASATQGKESTSENANGNHSQQSRPSEASDELQSKKDPSVVSSVKSEPNEKEYVEPEVTIVYEKNITIKKEIEESSTEHKRADAIHQCIVCKQSKKCKYNIVRNGGTQHLCAEDCFKKFRSNASLYLNPQQPQNFKCTVCLKSFQSSSPVYEGEKVVCSQACQGVIQRAQAQAMMRTCSQCKKAVQSGTDKQILTWESMDFCSEHCLGRFQNSMQTSCSYCYTEISRSQHAKNVLKVGDELNHFCGYNCLKEYKNRLKLCSYCQKDVAKLNDAFNAPVGDKGEFKDFCSRSCMVDYELKVKLSKGPSTQQVDSCSMCMKKGAMRHEILFEGKKHRLCGDACFAAFRYSNKLSMNMCDNCGSHCFTERSSPQYIQFEGQTKRFCSKMCMNTFKVIKRKLVPCTWCKAKKYNFDMIERSDTNNKYSLFCSLNCLSLYRVNLSATSNQRVKCDQCCKVQPAQYHLTMSDASVRNFCSYACVMEFQNQFTKPATQSKQQQQQPPRQQQQTAVRQPVQLRQRAPIQRQQAPNVRSQLQQPPGQRMLQPGDKGPLPVISNVMSIPTNKGVRQVVPTQQTTYATRRLSQTMGGQPANVSTVNVQRQPPPLGRTTNRVITVSTSQTQPTTPATKQVIIQPPPPKQVKNKSLQCKPFCQTKATSCRPQMTAQQSQTEEHKGASAIVPIPVPIYVPIPVHMYTEPVPVPIAFPVPIPVPCFIPTTKNGAGSILKHIKEILETIPSDPLEAELLMMAEMVAGADEESHDEKVQNGDRSEDDDGPPDLPSPVEPEEDNIPPELTNNAEPSPEELGENLIELALRASKENSENDITNESSPASLLPGAPQPDTPSPPTTRGSKRSKSKGGSQNKKRRLNTSEPPALAPISAPVKTPPPDADCALKYTYGVNAWKNWIKQKNLTIDTSRKGGHRAKPFKVDLLQMTADELNYSLCSFVKEVRKPNGDEYAADSIYYLCLGIQQYLYENARIDNVFTDINYEKFTNVLNDILEKFEPIISPEGYVLGRIEEEILWESRQLGAHSPHVLLNTLIYFNTKYFLLKDTSDHMGLSFAQVLKHWRKRQIDAGKQGPRTVFLRYFPPMSMLANKSKKKKGENENLEQAENLENPLRCPVKLYEFYLSKCPESMKNRSDVYYLVPERCCVPDSPVWYSVQALPEGQISKLLNRIKMTREINEALYNAGELEL